VYPCPGIYGTKAPRLPCTRALARPSAPPPRSQAPSLSIPKPVNTKDKLGGCACVRGCLDGPRECFLPEFFVPGSTWVIFAQRILGSS